MPRSVTIILTKAQANATMKALANCLQYADEEEQVAVFGSLQGANAALRAEAIIQKAITPTATPIRTIDK